jgi:LmbE family N-acetylglucosaminyl deacetylase
MQNNLYQLIAESGRPCIFISPHLDDAALSAGGLIRTLSTTNKVVIATVFTECSQAPYTMSARKMLFDTSMKDFESLERQRKLEDKEACAELGAECIHLGFTDAVNRKKYNPSKIEQILGKILPESLHIYPFYRLNIIGSNLSALDLETSLAVKASLRKLINQFENPYVFCPAAIGGHVDHVLVNEACKEIFPEVIQWADVPYNSVDYPDASKYPVNSSLKVSMLKKYVSQYDKLFKGGDPDFKEETFFIK